LKGKKESQSCRSSSHIKFGGELHITVRPLFISPRKS
jgi:hypothetical protein